MIPDTWAAHLFDKSLLYWASTTDLNKVRALVESGHDVNYIANEVHGTRPLHRAAHNSRTAICEYLLDHGADIHVQDAQGYTPLHLAAQFGDVVTVQLLLDRGADLTATTHKGADAIHMAMAFNNTPAVHAYLVRAKLAAVGGMSVREQRSRGRSL